MIHTFKQYSLIKSQLAGLGKLSLEKRDILMALLINKPMSDAQVNHLGKEARKFYQQYSVLKESMGEELKQMTPEEKESMLCKLLGYTSGVEKKFHKMQPDEIFDYFKELFKEGIIDTVQPTKKHLNTKRLPIKFNKTPRPADQTHLMGVPTDFSGAGNP